MCLGNRFIESFSVFLSGSVFTAGQGINAETVHEILILIIEWIERHWKNWQMSKGEQNGKQKGQSYGTDLRMDVGGSGLNVAVT